MSSLSAGHICATSNKPGYTPLHYRLLIFSSCKASIAPATLPQNQANIYSTADNSRLLDPISTHGIGIYQSEDPKRATFLQQRTSSSICAPDHHNVLYATFINCPFSWLRQHKIIPTVLWAFSSQANTARFVWVADSASQYLPAKLERQTQSL